MCLCGCRSRLSPRMEKCLLPSGFDNTTPRSTVKYSPCSISREAPGQNLHMPKELVTFPLNTSVKVASIEWIIPWRDTHQQPALMILLLWEFAQCSLPPALQPTQLWVRYHYHEMIGLAYVDTSFAQGLCDGEEENWCVDMSGNRWDRKTVRVHHLWLYKWDDFSIPDRSIWQVSCLLALLSTKLQAYRRLLMWLIWLPRCYKAVRPVWFSVSVDGAGAQRILWWTKVLDWINVCILSCLCISRSGTLAAIVAAKVRGIKAVSKIVDLIVEMRRSRDGVYASTLRFSHKLTGIVHVCVLWWAGLVETPQQMEFVLNVISLDKGKRKRPVSISPAIVPGTPRPWYRQVWVQHLSGVVILLIIVFVVSYFLDLGDPAAATARRSLVNLHCDPTASSSRNTVGRTGAAVDINMKNKCS